MCIRDSYLAAVRQKGAEIIDRARAEGKRILCLAGRPYHADPEINHGIDLLLTSLGLAVISEDCLSDREKKFPVHVLNQWTYHARLYAAAKYIGKMCIRDSRSGALRRPHSASRVCAGDGRAAAGVCCRIRCV